MLNHLFAGAALTPEQLQALKDLENELGEARAQMKRLEGKIADLEQQAADDHSVLTRPEFNREVARMLAFDERYGGTSSVLYYDFASLSGVASRYGQDMAAKATRLIAQCMMRYVRRSDIIGRLAADEFGVLLVRCDNDNAWRKGRELAALLAHELETLDGKVLGLDVSFGAYTFRDDENAASGIRQAASVMTKTRRETP